MLCIFCSGFRFASLFTPIPVLFCQHVSVSDLSDPLGRLLASVVLGFLTFIRSAETGHVSYHLARMLCKVLAFVANLENRQDRMATLVKSPHPESCESTLFQVDNMSEAPRGRSPGWIDQVSLVYPFGVACCLWLNLALHCNSNGPCVVAAPKPA